MTGEANPLMRRDDFKLRKEVIPRVVLFIGWLGVEKADRPSG